MADNGSGAGFGLGNVRYLKEYEMALSLGVTLGSRIKIGASIISILDVIDGRTISLLAEGKKHTITESERVEILPEVFVSCGVGNREWSENRSRFSRLAIEAPHRIRISRLQDAPAIG